jgi:hypothetical protein
MEIGKEVVPVNERLRCITMLNTQSWKIIDEYCHFLGAYGEYIEVEFSRPLEELRSPLVVPSPPFYVSVTSGVRYRARRADIFIDGEAIRWLIVRVPARSDPSILLWLGKPEAFFEEEGTTIHEGINQ